MYIVFHLKRLRMFMSSIVLGLNIPNIRDTLSHLIQPFANSVRDTKYQRWCNVVFFSIVGYL